MFPFDVECVFEVRGTQVLSAEDFTADVVEVTIDGASGDIDGASGDTGLLDVTVTVS